MNKSLSKLLKISQKSERHILGLMSGTSLDGLDIALCKLNSDADPKLQVLKFETVNYSDEVREAILKIQSKEEISQRDLSHLNAYLPKIWAEMILDTLSEWNISKDEIDVVASHGQTVFHAPSSDKKTLNSTLQIGDGDHLSEYLGMIVVSDFRQRHVAVGGEGAPLAGIMDEELFRSNQKNRVLLNLGGIGNFTYLPKDSEAKSITTDTGPANTLINEAMRRYFGKSFDDNGLVALSGEVKEDLLDKLMKHPFMKSKFPKTTGQEDFNFEFVESELASIKSDISKEDIVTTLAEFTVQSVKKAVLSVVVGADFELYISGGGIHNVYLVNGLSSAFPNNEILPFEHFGIHPDAKEAALIAFLADDLLMGNGFEVNEQKVSLGKISL